MQDTFLGLDIDMSSLKPYWLKLPDEILGEIMLMVGLESLESLWSCRQVCKRWNVVIMSNIWGNQTNKKRIDTRIERNWAQGEPKYSEKIIEMKMRINIQKKSLRLQFGTLRIHST